LGGCRIQTPRIGVRMSATSHRSLVGHRSELMAELLLQEFDPVSLARPSTDFGYDFLVSFTNSRGGINTFGVEVKGTEKEISSTFGVEKRVYDRLANSNIPMLLLVTDVKHNRLFYHWPHPQNTSKSHIVRIPVTEINEEAKRDLRHRFEE
jgi:Domain of unknown function (DUF4365)